MDQHLTGYAQIMLCFLCTVKYTYSASEVIPEYTYVDRLCSRMLLNGIYFERLCICIKTEVHFRILA